MCVYIYVYIYIYIKQWYNPHYFRSLMSFDNTG